MIEQTMGKLTQQSSDAIWNLYLDSESSNPNKERLLEYLTNKDNFSVFSKELAKIIQKKDSRLNDINSQLNYLISKAKEYNINIERNTLKNWLSGKTNPQGNATSRTNIYKLCFLLDFDFKQTIEFFTKAYLDRPFNYRKKEELVYAFCMNNNLTYDTAVQIIDQLSQSTSPASNNAYSHTRYIGNNVLLLKNINELIRFIQVNKAEFNKNNTTSIDLVKELMLQCQQITQKNLETNDLPPINKVLSEIYSDNLEGIRSEFALNTLSKASAFLDIVKMNFPQKQLYNSIIKGTASYHVIRKFLILLHFYVCFADKNSNYSFDDYLESADDMLFECGYSSLYYRNPYDWMFLYCASHDNPKNVFHEIMDLMFFTKCLEQGGELNALS